MEKEQRLKSIQNHDSAASLSASIHDYVAAYQSYLAASEEAKSLADSELDKAVSQQYLDLSDSYASKARECVRLGNISRDVLDKLTAHKPIKGFEAFVGLTDTKNYLVKDVVEPWKEGKFHERDLHCIMLYGPEGTAKSILAQAMTQEMGATCYFIKPFESFSVYNEDNAIYHMERIFKLGEERNNVVFFFPEPLAFFPIEDNKTSKLTTKIFLKIFIKELKKIKEKKLNILFVAGTSAPDKLSMKLFQKGIFDDLVKIHHPNEATRHDLIKERVKGCEISEEMLDYMAKLSKGWISKDTTRLAKNCKKFASLYQGDKETPVIDKEIVDKVMADFELHSADVGFGEAMGKFEKSIGRKVHIFDSRL